MKECIVKKIRKGCEDGLLNFIYANCICDGEELNFHFSAIDSICFLKIEKEDNFEFFNGDMKFENEEDKFNYVSSLTFEYIKEFEDMHAFGSNTEVARTTIDNIGTVEGKILNLLQYAIYFDYDKVKKAYEGKNVNDVEFDLIDLDVIEKRENEYLSQAQENSTANNFNDVIDEKIPF